MLQWGRIILGVTCLVLFVLPNGAMVGMGNDRHHQDFSILSEQESACAVSENRLQQTALLGSPTTDTNAEVHEVGSYRTFTLTSTPHDPILIVNNTDFGAQALDEGWPGDGSPGAPYVIGSYLINGSTGDGIKITHVTVHFIIQSCEVFNSSGSGVLFYNVTNGELFSSLCGDNNKYGVYVDRSSHLTVTENTIENNYDGGIGLHSSQSIEMSHNTITNNHESGIEGYGDTCSILHNEISNHEYGVYLLGLGNCEAYNNNITLSVKAAIYLAGSDNTIEYNLISKTDGFGICLPGPDNTIINNILWDCGFGYPSMGDLEDYRQTLVAGNLVNGNPLIFLQDEEDVLIDSLTTAGQVILLNCSSAQVERQELVNSTVGLYLIHSDNSILEDIVCTNHRACGMCIMDSSNVTVKDCDVSRNRAYIYPLDYFYGYNAGLILDDSPNATVSDTTISGNEAIGLTCSTGCDSLEVEGSVLNDNQWFGFCAYGTVFDCTLDGNTACGNGEAGIRMSYGVNCTISSNNASYNGGIGISLGGNHYLVIDNTASFNSEAGIYCGAQFGSSSTYNQFVGNQLMNNTYGIEIQSGFNSVSDNTIQAQWTQYSYCVDIVQSGLYPVFTPNVNNTIVWNDFISFKSYWVDDCTVHSRGENTTIEYNYYSTYEGTDADQDGIGDSIFYAGTHDPYPVMLPRDSAPVFLQEPADQTSTGTDFSYDLNATARPPGVDHWWISDTTHFTIDSFGLITSTSAIQPGVYDLEVRVYDHEGRSCSTEITITIPEPQTSTTTTGLTQPQGPLLVVAAIGAVIVIVLVVRHGRRASRS